MTNVVMHRQHLWPVALGSALALHICLLLGLSISKYSEPSSLERNIKVTLSATIDSSKHVVPLAAETLSKITTHKATNAKQAISNLSPKSVTPHPLPQEEPKKNSPQRPTPNTATSSNLLTQTHATPTYAPPLASSGLASQSSSMAPTAASGDAKHLNNPRPAYPQESRDNEEEGTVILNVYVLANGGVGDIKLQRSSGFFRLDDAALNTVRTRWKFVPATENGQAINSWHIQRIHFRLS